VYCSYWFEQVAPTHLFDVIPVDNILFETDFPHMACLYDNVAETIETGLANASEDVRRKVLWENSARLYGIKEPVLQ
jgi:predicted TIM-barrel fold metal-dependent hydrolase